MEDRKFISAMESVVAALKERGYDPHAQLCGYITESEPTLFQNGDEPIRLSAITAGGSQALFFKVNTWGEEAFLDKLRELL